MPPDPPKAFSVSQSASHKLCRKKALEKNVEIMAPPLAKFLATPLVYSTIYSAGFLDLLNLDD